MAEADIMTEPTVLPPRDREAAERVFRLAAEGLAAMAGDLGAAFAAALDCIGAVRGRVIVTGMGKSGHVARKIAATLASTGTPSHFVHPAEASHGDLGMITAGDVVLALSNSGETPELVPVIEYVRRFRIPLVALVGRAASTLAAQADAALVIPATPEACPLGLAPTTSTTLMMALGDALAVALLERRGFSAQDFRRFHPGGQLGKQLTWVRELMHHGESMPLAAPDTPMAEAILEITAKQFGCVGVVDAHGALVGIVTDGDLRRHMGPTLLASRAADVMTRAPKTAAPDMIAAEVLALMEAHKITGLFVVEAGRPIGILNIHDLLRAGVV